jgi:hypothetical protein
MGRVLGRSFDGLGKLAVFEAARSRSYAKLFCKNYSIVFFVHFGRGELYLEMMLQDKLVNPCQTIHMELAHLLRSAVRRAEKGGETAGTKPERNDRRRVADGSNPFMR